MQPPWLKPDNTSWLGSNWFLWTQENLYQNYRDICFAAEHGLAEAMMNLAFEFEYGFSVIQKDLVRAYVWYRLAANSGYDQAIANLERIEKTQLSSEQLGEAERLLNAQVPGQCVKDIKLLRSREPKFKVQTNNQTR
jgi:TPR repeat protein